MLNPILLSAPSFEGNEELYISKVLATPYIAAGGDFLNEFELALANHVHPKKVVGLNSGTSAIHLGLKLLGVQPGDHVICQSFTFCASANPIVYLGANPIFIDSEPQTWNMCPDALQSALIQLDKKGELPKAIIVVDLFGMPAKYDEILDIARNYGIPVLEDAAESMGSSYKNQPCGSFGDLGVFSFNGNKIITTGGGGALISNDMELLNRSRKLASQAREEVHYFEHTEIGYNYRLGNIQAAIGKAQIEGIKEKIAGRRHVFLRYQKALGGLSGISFLDEPEGAFSNRWLTTIRINPSLAGFDKDRLRLSLQENHIESRFVWKPLHLQKSFQGFKYFGGEIAANIFDQSLCLPSSPQLQDEEIERVVSVIRNLVDKSKSHV
ncbi:DegT/DnrJ/EryC1/StrS family aminotransferase [Belliella kenyensis]|uniref:DegT/DnrJ/EryC1/StrS family aminotransferase n=1 Tax=Belliella kenyensis TaxID=1472724 RepID=A0ABV8EFV1_9BACT|nr:DegT/DnrJ/EryC1/StrS family aminotransferase [Belliella kenyensis]MCH7401748.1 DegT/DnrJ/EryC1/StrS family aminotransferase [Belliella kenyensis]MDN3604247.1 DegT/DnrJ/EryC1/StrS family aminotransferase [Belliella kenyensis]